MYKLIPNFFFFFLAAPILSPYVSGITVYIYAFIPFLDIKFYIWCKKNFIFDHVVKFFLILFLCFLTTLDIKLLAKLVMLFVTVLYCLYCYFSGFFYLYRWVVFNVVVAIFQFVFIFIDPDVARLIGPTNISIMFLGDYAGPTLTNFYAISYLPRVCGLSREGGFFAAFLGISFYILIQDKSLKSKSKRLISFFIIIGVVISLSKMTAVLLLAPIVFYFRSLINKIGVLGSFLLTIVILTTFSFLIFNLSNIFYDIGNETLIHRFSGYGLLLNADVRDLVFGTTLPTLMAQYGPNMAFVHKSFLSSGYDFCGLPALYLGYGIMFFMVFIFTCKVIELKPFSIPLLVLFTVNVDPITSTGFVVLSWFYCFLISLKK